MHNPEPTELVGLDSRGVVCGRCSRMARGWCCRQVGVTPGLSITCWEVETAWHWLHMVGGAATVVESNGLKEEE